MEKVNVCVSAEPIITFHNDAAGDAREVLERLARRVAVQRDSTPRYTGGRSASCRSGGCVRQRIA